MKILHVTFTYLPDPPAGTEVYVGQLCRALERGGIASVVAAPGPVEHSGPIEGVKVRRFVCDPDRQALETLYGAGDPVATAGFERVLLDERPDVVHQHALSPACSVDLVRCAARHGVPVVFTVHTPAVFCQRGSLLRWGRDMCDVAWSHDACTRCVLDEYGVGGVVGRMVASVPVGVGRVVGRRGLAGGAWTALRLPELMQERLAGVDELFTTVSRVVSLCQWTTRLLEANGVAPERIVYCPHGVEEPSVPVERLRTTSRPLRFVHLGRLDPTKGTMLIAQALSKEPSLPITLDIYGVQQAGVSDGQARQVRVRAAQDPRITLHPAIPHDTVARRLQEFDAVLVPSQFAETGPLVVLEAFSAGVPVIGSALAGIAEKVRHDVDGVLVAPFHDESAWRQVMRRCVEEPNLLSRLRDGVKPPRTVAAVADQMADLYREVVSSASAVTR